MQDLYDFLFKPAMPWGINGDCDDGKYTPTKYARAPYDKPGVCAAGSYWPYPDGGAQRDAESPPTPPDTQTYYTSNDGYTVPVAGASAPQGSPQRPVQGPPMPSTPLAAPLPPERPQGLGVAPAPTALQRYQAATTPPSFGSVPAGQFGTLRPEVQGPPMPSQQAPVAWEPNFVRQDGGGDPASAMNFMHQEAMRNPGDAGGSLFAKLFPTFNDGGQGASNGSGRPFQWVRPDSIVGKLMSLLGDDGSGQATLNQTQGGDGSGVPSLGAQMENSRDAQANNIQGMARTANGGSSSMGDLAAFNQAAMAKHQAWHQSVTDYAQGQAARAQADAQASFRKSQLNNFGADTDSW